MSYKDLNAFMTVCSTAGIADVAFATVPPNETETSNDQTGANRDNPDD